MLAGMVAGAGYYMGSQPLPVNFRPEDERLTNPKGNFEDVEVNAINTEILAPLFPRPWPTRIGRALQQRRVLSPGFRWAASLPPDIEVSASDAVATRIQVLTVQRPFCLKDPRFCHTLPAWRPFIGDAVFICVFREPARTANSIVTEWRRYGRRYAMTYERALATWRSAYTQVLDRHRHIGEWMFVHYDQILDESAIPRIERFLGTALDRSFPESRLKRSSGTGPIPSADQEQYLLLCQLAGYTPQVPSAAHPITGHRAV